MCEDGLQKINFQFELFIAPAAVPLTGVPSRWYRRQVAYTCTPNTGHRGNTSPLHVPSRAIAKKNFRFPTYSKAANGFLCTRACRSCVLPAEEVYFKNYSRLFCRHISVVYMPRVRCLITSRWEILLSHSGKTVPDFNKIRTSAFNKFVFGSWLN